MFKKGTILLRKRICSPTDNKNKIVVLPLHQDLIQESFWEANCEILNIQPVSSYTWKLEVPLPELVVSQLHLNAEQKQSETETS